MAAADVEAALFGRYGAGAEYRQHARMLRQNLALPGNAELRAHVLSGDLGAEELITMDSAHLAPEALQQRRREAELKLMRELVIEELVPDRGDSSPGHSGYNANTGPPPMVRSPLKELPADEEEQEATGEAGPPPISPMEPPPPTPFREFSTTSPAAAHPPTPDMLATPAHDDEDDEHTALLRFLSSPPP
ncbi:unnamed protein product [Polarella glacialis]|uniref:TFIIS central domain-containing protein n=1 Tax=Polarella glacialis TaxID=89957 RepID=A0A813GCS0_POLGL|nr:unnamed protein product [Polarella glacialis]